MTKVVYELSRNHQVCCVCLCVSVIAIVISCSIVNGHGHKFTLQMIARRTVFGSKSKFYYRCAFLCVFRLLFLSSYMLHLENFHSKQKYCVFHETEHWFWVFFLILPLRLNLTQTKWNKTEEKKKKKKIQKSIAIKFESSVVGSVPFFFSPSRYNNIE